MAARQREKRDYYQVLRVSKNADDAELKRAYRELARKYHPDINSRDGSEERFKEINEAYAVLSDSKMRARYDRHGHSAVGGAPSGESGGFGTVVDAVDDLISDLLRRRRQSKRRGRDLRYTLEIDLAEAAFGCEKTISMPDPKYAGDGDAPDREYAVSIPAGTKDGQVRRIRGEGRRGTGGAAAGDLNILIRVVDHPVLRREGFDLWCDVPVSFPQAALGAVIDVPTLEGKVRLRVPPGTQSGRVMRMRAKGIPRTASRTGLRGDQMVRINVETPVELTERQRELLEKFAAESGDTVAHPQQQGFLDKLRSLFRD